MSSATRLGLGILGVGLALGALGDALLRATPWGLNVPLWTAGLVVGMAALGRWQRLEIARSARWLVLPVLVGAATFAWRAAPALLAANGLAALVALGLIAFGGGTRRLPMLDVLDYALGAVVVGLNAGFGFLALVFHDVKWQELPRGSSLAVVLAIGRGLLLAIPILVVFGALFVAADAVFAGLVSSLFAIPIDQLVSHLLLFGFITWVVAGLLRIALLAGEWALPPGAALAIFSLGIVEIAVALGLLDLLFLAFVAVQVRYLFGGAALVAVSPTLTYAEYARQGFFELVIVAALVLPTLLLAHSLLKKHPPHERIFRALAVVLVALLYVIVASALQRMRLYQEAYGLTELRLYATAFMLWLATVFAWLALTVLRGQRQRFAFGAVVLAFLALGALDVLNPDALIVRTNVARSAAAAGPTPMPSNRSLPAFDRSPQPGIDDAYLRTLSADAVPPLVATLPSLPEPQRRKVAAGLLEQWSPPAAVDWRTWSWSRSQAWQTVSANKPALRQLAGR